MVDVYSAAEEAVSEAVTMAWHTYMLTCADGTLYTGSTNDLERRLKEHNESGVGAKYTRTRRPVTLTFSVECPDRSTALKEEARIKSLTRVQKLALIGA